MAVHATPRRDKKLSFAACAKCGCNSARQVSTEHAAHYPASRIRGFKTILGETKLLRACFNCESTSSAMVTTSNNTLLKSTLRKLRCKVLKMLICKIRDSSTTMGTV